MKEKNSGRNQVVALIKVYLTIILLI